MFGTRHQLPSQINTVAIDKLAQEGNGAAIQNQLDNMIMFLGLTAQFFDYVKEDKVKAVCKQLQEKGYGLTDSKVAFDKIRDTCQKFPSFADILSLMPKKYSNDSKYWNEHREVCKKETELCEKIEIRFKEVFGAEKLESFCQWWVKECMAVSNEELGKWGVNYLLFKNSALLDWHDSYYTTKFDRLKEVVSKKNETLKEIQERNIKAQRVGARQNLQLPRINKNMDFRG